MIPELEKLVEPVARAIAINGFGRPWNDFHDCYAHDTDKGDLREYAAAVLSTPELQADLAAALRAACEGEAG